MFQKISAVLLSVSLFVSCSLYSSAGRKQFEERAPASTLQTFSLLGCRNLNQAEAWFKQEFPALDSELVEANADYEVWLQGSENTPWEASVLTKNDSSKEDFSRLCTYQFASREVWLTQRKGFLMELSNSLVDLED
jgi:hypothetical protein